MHVLSTEPARRYLELLRHCLCRDHFPDERYAVSQGHLQKLPFDAGLRARGKDWPTEAVTMVGSKRLRHLEKCCVKALQEGIAGDFVETGIWRGGCGILMRAVLAAAGDVSRNVWLFDSFRGLPKPDVQAFPQDEPDRLWTFNNYLGVSVEEVKANFERFNLLDERTQFVSGWFRDTIPDAAVNSISVLRLDGDLYESTWLVLTHLYPKVAPGGFIIVDDYALQTCKAAVDDFRSQHSIDSAITEINWSGIFWRKPGKSRLARSNNRARIRLLAAKFRA
jgi:O-methyltransferase